MVFGMGLGRIYFASVDWEKAVPFEGVLGWGFAIVSALVAFCVFEINVWVSQRKIEESKTAR